MICECGSKIALWAPPSDASNTAVDNDARCIHSSGDMSRHGFDAIKHIGVANCLDEAQPR
jgi:hypothetical protein